MSSFYQLNKLIFNNYSFRHGASGYQDQSQYVDQYQHGGYNSGVQSQGTYSANGGYNQSYGAQNSQLGYQQSGEYDHSSTGYQDYRFAITSYLKN